MSEKISVDKIREIEGLENYEGNKPQMPYIKIINGSAATESDLPAGTVVGIDNEVLAEKDKLFVFIPIYLFSRYAIWDNETRSLVKFAFSKRGQWSDGSTIMQEEIGWVGKNPPIATESLDIVILPVTELNKTESERTYYMMSIPKRNKQKAKFCSELVDLFAKTSVEQCVAKLYGCSYSFQPEKVKDDRGNVWFEYANPKFEKKIQEDSLLICQGIYNETKELNKVSSSLTPVLIEEGVAPSADVVENPEF